MEAPSVMKSLKKYCRCNGGLKVKKGIQIFNETKREAVEHYDRMIEWVKTQHSDEIVNIDYMEDCICEKWSDDYCSYCVAYSGLNLCGICPLYAKLNNEGASYNCCNNHWWRMAASRTWKDWLYYAERVRIYILLRG